MSGGVRPLAVVPARVYADDSLSYAALGVYAVLTACPSGVPDVEVLAGRGLDLDEVRGAVRELVDRGLVERRIA